MKPTYIPINNTWDEIIIHIYINKFFIKKKTSLYKLNWLNFYKFITSFILFFKFKVSSPLNNLTVSLVNPSKYLTNNVWFLKYYLKLFKLIKINSISWNILFKYLNKWKVVLLTQMITN